MRHSSVSSGLGPDFGIWQMLIWWHGDQMTGWTRIYAYWPF